MLAMLVNPYGIEAFRLPFVMFAEMRGSVFRDVIGELKSPFAFGWQFVALRWFYGLLALSFVSADGVALYGELYRADTDSDAPVVLLFHQGGGSSEEYEPLAPRLNALGYHAIAVADALSDALGIHLAEEADPNATQHHIWSATVTTFLTKFVFAISFAVPVLLLLIVLLALIGTLAILMVVVLVGFSLVFGRTDRTVARNTIIEIDFERGLVDDRAAGAPGDEQTLEGAAGFERLEHRVAPPDRFLTGTGFGHSRGKGSRSAREFLPGGRGETASR